MKRKAAAILALALIGAMLLVACGGGESTAPGGTTAGNTSTGEAATGGTPPAGGEATAAAGCTGQIDGTYTLKAWFHSGTGAEREALQAQVEAFHNSQDKVKVELVLLPEGNYNDQVKAAAASGNLPDILDFDGPLLYNYAWNGDLQPLDSCISQSLKADLLPSIVDQGTYAGRLYGVGTFDSGLALYARKSVLEQAGIRIPTGIDDAWTAEEFTAALKKLQAAGFARPLDLKYNYGRGEWFTYGFSPIIQSAGGDLIDRSTYQTADGVLNSAASVSALQTFQSWFADGLVHFNEADNSFVSGEAAVSWVGHWQFVPYREAFGDDLIILPLPDFGQGSKTGLGSWQWGITTSAQNADAAWAFIEFLLQPGEVLRMTQANGAVPATRSAAAQSAGFAPGGPQHLYIQQLESIAVARPQTPAYPTITAAYAKAIQDISEGKDAKTALDEAVRTIDQDIEDNQGYPIIQ